MRLFRQIWLTVLLLLFMGSLETVFAKSSQSSSGDRIAWTEVSAKATVIRPGKSVRFAVAVTPKSSGNDIRWSSSDPSIAGINTKTGRITGHKAGKVTITASLHSLKIKRTVYVKPNVLIASSLSDCSSVVKALKGKNVVAYCGYSSKISMFDGLIIPGGITDRFSEDNKDVTAKQEKRQTALIRKFAKAKKPVLAICRGMELLERIYGGKVKEAKNDSGHSDDVYRYVRIRKEAAVTDPDSIFCGIRTKKIITLHSHVRAFSAVPDDFIVIAEDYADRTVEAIQHRRLKIYGIQWHPERGLKSSPENQMIFDNFVNIMCRNA